MDLLRIWERNLFYLIIFAALFCQSGGVNVEVRGLLHRRLLNESYDPDLRPVNDTSVSVPVGFRFAPTISILNEITQELELKGMMVMTWEDPRLRWDPKEYDGLDETHITVIKSGENIIWRPELVLNESLETEFQSFKPETLIANLDYTGRVYWYTLAVTRSFCGMNVRYYPFDKQICSLTFTTWVYQSNEQTFYTINDLTTKDRYKKYLISQSIWDVNLKKVEVGKASYDCHTCKGEQQTYISYSLELTRKQRLVYFANLVLPCLVMSSMTFLVILLPHGNDSGTAAFGLTCVLTLIVFLTFLFNTLPSTGQTILGGYIVWLIVEGVFITFYAVMNSHMGGEIADGVENEITASASDVNCQGKWSVCLKLRKRQSAMGNVQNPTYNDKSRLVIDDEINEQNAEVESSATLYRGSSVAEVAVNAQTQTELQLTEEKTSYICLEKRKKLMVIKYCLIAVKVVSTLSVLVVFTVVYTSYNH